MIPIIVFLAFLFSALAVWMFAVEPRRVEFNRHRIQIRKSLPRLLKILHLSDIHFSGPDARIERLFDRIAAIPVDMIIVTGDIIDCPQGLEYCMQNMKKLKAEAGKFVVLGNHDYYDYHLFDAIFHNFPGQGYPVRINPYKELTQGLEGLGFQVLKNRTVETDFEGVRLLIHGMDDATTGRANVRKTMENYDPEKINILLSHTIDVFLDIGAGEIDLAFSGHSHGGQVRLPWIGPIITHTMLGKAYASGIKEIQGAQCSISRGISAGRYTRLRLLCLPEVLILEVSGS